MKQCRSVCLTIGLLGAAMPGLSQQTATRPVLSAPPQAAAPAPAADPPIAAMPETPPEISSTYMIGPADVLQITVWKEQNFSGSVTVRPDGMISLPLVGDVAAAGMTPMRLGSNLATRLKKYINDPLVTVTVAGVNSKRIFLLGEVQHIGPLSLVQGMTPLQAISAAGGLTPYANKKHIYILRGEEGKQQKIPYNYNKALKDGNQQGVSLFPGDTIVVR